MADKQITDLDLAASFGAGDLLLVRKMGEGVDKAITQQTFIETLGNPSVTGFTATSTVANQVVLVPSNDVVIDKYYDQMVVTFISPITSTGAVTIKIGSLTFRTLQELGTTTTSTLTTSKFYSAIFIGSATTGTFFQTNVVTPSIFTNEYTAVGTVAGGGASTTYALTTAIGASKTTTGYYVGMSALFTVDITSQGAVIVNIDGLGNKTLLDPVGDDVPFELVMNEAILAIYDGTSFRKHMFSSLEPDNPDPVDKIVTVGAGGYASIDLALNQLITDYGVGEKNFTGTIQLLPGFAQTSLLRVNKNTPWITIKTAAGGNNCYGFNIQAGGNINFSGTFNHVLSGSTNPAFLTIDYGAASSEAKCVFTNSIINCTNVNDNIATTAILFLRGSGAGTKDPTVFYNVSINGFHIYYSAYQADQSTGSSNFQHDTGTINMRSSGSQGQANEVIYSNGDHNISNINFNNVDRTQLQLIRLDKTGSLTNVSMTSGSDSIIFRRSGSSSATTYLTNCAFRKTSLTAQPTVLSDSSMVIDGGNYTRTVSNPGGIYKDIQTAPHQNAIIYIRNGAQGVQRAVSPGQIINE